MGPGITSSRAELVISALAHWPCFPHGERRADCKVVPGIEGNPEQTDAQAEKQHPEQTDAQSEKQHPEQTDAQAEKQLSEI